jgi:hypothetical protein
MQKTSLSLAILTAILVIVILMVPEQGVVVKASVDSNASILVTSPLSYESYVYNISSVNISVAVIMGLTYLPEWFKGMTGIYESSISYSLDGKPNETLSLSGGNLGRGTLNDLSDGYHYLEVYCYGYFDGSASRTFLINATGYHTPQFLSPLNTTYAKNKVPFTYTSDQNKYSTYYKLDNSDYTTITSNITLSGITDGQHAIYIKAMNGDSLYSQQTTYFSVNTTKNNSLAIDSQVILVISVSAVAVLLAVAAVIYRRRKASLRIAGKGFES